MNDPLDELTWPCRLRPKPDEILSSWLVRLSACLVVKLQTFTTRHLGMHAGFWTGDIDRYANPSVLSILSENTNTPINCAIDTTLSSYAGKLWEECHPGPLMWINNVGRYGRSRTGFGQQYCRACLAEDQEPYFRKHWRLAFNVACLRHGIYLRDSCSFCQHPIEFHATDYGVKLLAEDCQITICRHCHSDIRLEGLHIDMAPPIEIFKLQSWMSNCIKTGYGSIDGQNTYPALLIFMGLRRLLGSQMSGSRTSRVMASIKESYGQLPLKDRHLKRKSLETIRIGDRAWLLLGLYKLLQYWPDEFVRICRENKISSSYLKPYRTELPYWLSSTLNWHLHDEDYSPSDMERQSVATFLARRDFDVNQSNINLLLGTSAVSISRKTSRFRWNPRGITNVI